MTRFRCKLNGAVFEFLNDFDIKDMQEHPDYEEVVEVEEIVKKETPKRRNKGEVL